MAITVYIADDHAVVRDGLRALLENVGGIAYIGGAADGRTAVREVCELQPDVVLMDISMPELNGIEATQQIREAVPAVRVIILSMHSTTEHVYRALQAGARGYLLKESAGKDLVAAVQAVAQGKRFLSEKLSELMMDDIAVRGGAFRDQSPLERLSAREREILQLVAEGRTSAEIAAVLFLSPKSVDTYRSRLMQKLGIKDYPALIRFALQHGLTRLE
ncbi:MAG: response regulator transcription factor [Ignavibacteriae bacterium]|nr:response regulator transcription factor [Ignavibacteriota bacterium]